MHASARRSSSGMQTALRYTGIPPSWLAWRPKMPSRNWLIFMTVVGGTTLLWADDRRKCKQIKQQYIERVQHLADEPLHKFDWARKVKVYSCRWPEDHDHGRSLLYFKKYVKPIFVAAALDFEIVNGNHYGVLTNLIAEEVKRQRRVAAGLEKDDPRTPLMTLPGDRSARAKKMREMEGGVIIVGRHTLKEYMEGLRRGWSESVMPVDREERLAQELQNDGYFDEQIEESLDQSLGSQQIIPPPKIQPPPRPPALAFGGIGALRRPPPPNRPPAIPAFSDTPPASIPPQPPIGLIPFTNYRGFRQFPYMIYGFFTQRYKVQSACEAAYRVVAANTRPMTKEDLLFDQEAEQYVQTSFEELPTRTETAKKDYYKELSKNLKIARELARYEREPSRSETANPPPTEVELRAERLKKELKWLEDLEGWEILRADVAWDERFDGALTVFDDSTGGL